MFNSIFHQNLDVAKTNMFLVVTHPSSSLFLHSLALRSFTAEETWFPMCKSQPRPIPGTENYLSSHVQAAISEPRLSTTWTLSTATATFTQTPKPKSQFSESWSCRCSADFPGLGLKATQTQWQMSSSWLWKTFCGWDCSSAPHYPPALLHTWGDPASLQAA